MTFPTQTPETIRQNHQKTFIMAMMALALLVYAAITLWLLISQGWVALWLLLPPAMSFAAVWTGRWAIRQYCAPEEACREAPDDYEHPNASLR